MIKSVIFDMAGVYINPHDRRLRKKIAKVIGKKEAAIRKAEIVHEDRIMCNKLTPEQFWKNVCKRLGVKYDKKILKIWSSGYKPDVNKNVKKIVLKLKKKYRVAMITDVSADRVRYNNKKGLYNLFTPCIKSCSVRARKPYLKIYRITLKRLNLKPKECIFIDDKPKNIRGCKKLGMKGIVFKNATQLKRDLKKHGIFI
ncbi:HAD-IA family hydrolase [Candidatus Aenigmatarchaeota archaeon]